MQKVMVALVVVFVAGALGWFIFRQMSAVVATADAISADVVAPYVGHLKAGQFDEAWDSCLAEPLQLNTPRAAFVAAHAARVEQYGPLAAWTQTTYQHEANLFTDESAIGIRGVLHYERRDVFVLYMVDSKVEPYRIQQIFGSDHGSSTLSEGTW